LAKNVTGRAAASTPGEAIKKKTSLKTNGEGEGKKIESAGENGGT